MKWLFLSKKIANWLVYQFRTNSDSWFHKLSRYRFYYQLFNVFCIGAWLINIFRFMNRKDESKYMCLKKQWGLEVKLIMNFMRVFPKLKWPQTSKLLIFFKLIEQKLKRLSDFYNFTLKTENYFKKVSCFAIKEFENKLIHLKAFREDPESPELSDIKINIYTKIIFSVTKKIPITKLTFSVS